MNKALGLALPITHKLPVSMSKTCQLQGARL